MKQDLHLLWQYLKRHTLPYLLGIFSLLCVDAINIYIPQIAGSVTDGLVSHTLDMHGIVMLGLRILGFGLIIAIGRFGWRYFLFGSARSVEREMRDDLFTHIELLSASWYGRNKTGDIMAHFTNDLAAIRKLLGMTVITAVDATVMLILVLHGMISFVSLRLTLIAIIPLILIVFGDIIFGKIMHRRFLERQEAFSTLTDAVQESISGIRVIKAFVQEQKELREFAKINRNAQEKNLRVVRLMALVFPLLDFIIGISTLVTLIYGGRMAIYSEITLGQFVAFNSYITMLVWPMIAAGECISSFSQGMASVHRIAVIMNEQPEIQDNSNTHQDIQILHGEIDINDLSFSYPSVRCPVLSDISCHISSGETLGIIGRTGSGKSTLVSLLERLYDTTSPQMILIDGHPLSEIPLHVLHSCISIVPQDSFLFSDTIARNIAFSNPNASFEEIERAAQAACIHDNIMDFPEQYDTMLGERGVTVSGGQKQRIAIARALLKDAPILILDDSLSAVDTDTEDHILQNLHRLRQGKTTIIVASRISTVEQADHILVLDEGRKAEYGTHAELMDKNGIYASIYNLQQLERELHESHSVHEANPENNAEGGDSGVRETAKPYPVHSSFAARQ